MLTIAERRARLKAERFHPPLRGGRVFCIIPSTSYWASTFTESIRDKSSAHNPTSLKLTGMGGRRIPLGPLGVTGQSDRTTGLVRLT